MTPRAQRNSPLRPVQDCSVIAKSLYKCLVEHQCQAHHSLIEPPPNNWHVRVHVRITQLLGRQHERRLARSTSSSSQGRIALREFWRKRQTNLVYPSRRSRIDDLIPSKVALGAKPRPRRLHRIDQLGGRRYVSTRFGRTSALRSAGGKGCYLVAGGELLEKELIPMNLARLLPNETQCPKHCCSSPRIIEGATHFWGLCDSCAIQWKTSQLIDMRIQGPKDSDPPIAGYDVVES
jgi:hypothetical protein